MTREAVIWIHDALPSPPLTVIGGSVFSYRDITYDPLDAPVLKIRPIDDNQKIPFLVRVEIEPVQDLPVDGAVIVTFPAPLIFDPRLDHVEGRVDSEPVLVSVERSYRDSLLTARIPLAPHDESAARRLGDTITVTIEGELMLEAYRPLAPRRFGAIRDLVLDPDIAELARLEVERDVAAEDERTRLERVAETFDFKTATDYDRVLAVNSWVGDQLRYEEGPAERSAVQALDDRSGDCDEHTTLAAALLRTLGIPARRVTGLLYNLDTLSPHVWVEVALPNRRGELRWFIIDPTLAGTTTVESEKTEYVQYRGRVLLYPIKPTVRLEGLSGRVTSDALLNWRNPDTELLRLDQLASFVERAAVATDREISRGAERLARTGSMLPRQSASIVGSPYLLVDRQITPDRNARIRLRLENEERLLLELVAGEGSALESAHELDTIDQLRSAYNDINRVLFDGTPAHHNLELFYTRNRHSDRLTTVSLRIGRYLVEHFLKRILKQLSRSGVLTEQETARLSAVAEATEGRNLYILQELAGRLPAAESP
jgi:transglutaminase-like putative cysteine protease